MTLDQAIRRLREGHDENAPTRRLPTPEEVVEVERRLQIGLHPDFRRYLLEASHVSFGTMEAVTVVPPTAHTDLVAVALLAWNELELQRDLVPICEDNGDYYCVASGGEVVLWLHDEMVNSPDLKYSAGDKFSFQTWPTIADWIENVWLRSALG